MSNEEKKETTCCGGGEEKKGSCCSSSDSSCCSTQDKGNCCSSGCETCWPCIICKKMTPYIHWVLRLAFAAVFIYHGVPKLMDPASVAQMVGLSSTVMLIVGLVEVSAGVLVLAGGIKKCCKIGDFITRLGGLLTVPVLVYAIAEVHWGQWSFMATESHPAGGIEFQVVLLAIALYFMSRGGKV